jgi:hypothetical protein
MIVSPRSSSCLSGYVAKAAAGASSLTTTSRLPSEWRARKSFSPYFPRRCWWTGKALAGSRATAVAIAREHAVFHDAIGYPSGAPEPAKEPTNGPVTRDLRLYALAVRLREVPGTRYGKTS